MNEDDVKSAIVRTCRMIGKIKIIVVGSQSLHAFLSEKDLPEVAMLSKEIDIYIDSKNKLRDDQDRLHISTFGGEEYFYHDLYGHYLDPVDPNLIVLPVNWRNRVQPISIPNELKRINEPNVFRGLCIQPADLAVAKLAAFREKDLACVGDLIRADQIDPELILQRMDETPSHWQSALENGRSFVKWFLKN